MDDQILAELADRLMQLSARRVEEGRIEVVDGVVTAIAPAPGAVLADPASRIVASLAVIAGGGGPRQLELSTDPILPDVPFEDLEREAARLDAVLDGDVTLVVGAARTMPISEAALRRAAVVAWDRETGWDLHLLSAPLEAWVKAHRRDVQIPGVDARLAIEDPWVRIVPSVPSKVPDTDGISTRVQEALTSITRAASVP
ncbi:MAG: hypothetical protein GWN07_20935, partial [Actinobacteria bacterium]|nr:hypothetical protein [Actinomycetota bacterium]NIX22160.1 hypothetical protein [Actinomycetota bacterium]